MPTKSLNNTRPGPRRLAVLMTVVAFCGQALLPSCGLAQGFPSGRVALSAEFTPVLLQGIKVNRQDPFSLEFIVQHGTTRLPDQDRLQEYQKVVKYFLTGLTVPDADLWVNLSPYEKDRMIPATFGTTGMGRDLLAQDYLLKQISASLMYPEEDLGQAFWDKVYAQAEQRFGTRNIPVQTFNKVWIVPDQAVVYEGEDTAFVVESRLKVMLEADYLALARGREGEGAAAAVLPEDQAGEVNGLSSEVVREVIIPALEQEVNTGKNFASLRQIYQSLILATWYKQVLRDYLLGRIYVDQNKVAGVEADDPAAKDKIYQQYLTAFKDGVYRYIREEYDPAAQTMTPRRYFAGGTSLNSSPILERTRDPGRFWQAFRRWGFRLTALALLSVAFIGCKKETRESWLARFPAADTAVVVGEETAGSDGQIEEEPQLPDDNTAVVVDEETAGSDGQIGQTPQPVSLFLPRDGKTAYFLGQGQEVIESYISRYGKTPPGFMTYTSIQLLQGLNEPAIPEHGGHYAQYFLDKYPNMAMHLALYAVNALEDINAGVYDENIDRLAEFIKAAGRPVYFRPFYEVENPNNNYDPDQLKDAWRRIVDRFDELGVNNVAYVWHSVNLEHSLETAEAYYPGDAYVDYVAISLFGLDQAEWGKGWVDFAEQHGKPVIIAESGPHGRTSVADRIAWWNGFLQFIHDAKVPIVSYINGSFDPELVAREPEAERYMDVFADSETEKIFRDEMAQEESLDTLENPENPENPYEPLGYDPETNGPIETEDDQEGDPLVQLDEGTAIVVASPVGADSDKVASTDPVGGIDLTQNFLYLQIKRDPDGRPLAVEFQDLDQIQFDGLQPVLLHIIPNPNLPQFLGIN